MKVSFILREDKTDKAGLAPGFVNANFEGVRLQCFTREKCRAKDWNAAKQEFRRSMTGAEEANNVLAANLVVGVVGINFCQQVNGKFYALNNNSTNPLAIEYVA